MIENWANWLRRWNSCPGPALVISVKGFRFPLLYNNIIYLPPLSSLFLPLSISIEKISTWIGGGGVIYLLSYFRSAVVVCVCVRPLYSLRQVSPSLISWSSNYQLCELLGAESVCTVQRTQQAGNRIIPRSNCTHSTERERDEGKGRGRDPERECQQCSAHKFHRK